jgi:hypothetical protein
MTYGGSAYGNSALGSVAIEHIPLLVDSITEQVLRESPDLLLEIPPDLGVKILNTAVRGVSEWMAPVIEALVNNYL